MLGSIPCVSPRNRRFTWDAGLMCESTHSRSSLLCSLWVMGYMRVAHVGCWQEHWRGTCKFRSIPIFSSPPFLLFLPGKRKDISMILRKLLVLKTDVGAENNSRKKRAGTLRFGQNFCVGTAYFLTSCEMEEHVNFFSAFKHWSFQVVELLNNSFHWQKDFQNASLGFKILNTNL